MPVRQSKSSFGLGRVALVVVASALILGFVFHRAVLAGIGGYLVREQAPEKADIAIVLAGDPSGARILKAGELVREGYAPQVLVSGPSGAYGFHECELAIPYAVRAGYPETYFRHMEHMGRSTRDEAQVAAPILHRIGVHTVLLVTSDFHTRRAGNVFREVIPDVSFIVVGTPDEYFTAGGWWHDREARKITVLEWSKTVANWFDM